MRVWAVGIVLYVGWLLNFSVDVFASVFVWSGFTLW